ncbi:hypothetical protein [Streptomyces sp. DSM 40907]|uniref:hypothetical protein n=1 Tax=Streptomyces kutzneri TaxID=3051179 RepID=UPI0028D4FA67|nr:hypothetical protein [Streptomyces sp. DSM 40907]
MTPVRPALLKFGTTTATYFDDGEEFATYDLLVEWKEQSKTGGPKPDSPDTWSVPISAPLLPKIVDIGHEQVYAALSTVGFHDRESSPWGHATQDLQEWLFLPENVSGLERKPSDAAAVAVLLARVYGDKGHLLLAEANRYLEPSRGEG